MTAELGSQMYEQIALSPAARERPNWSPTPLPHNRHEFIQQCLLDNSKERREIRRRDALLSTLDDNQALVERANLLQDPIYTGKIEPTGDGSVIIIQPGFGRGENDYLDAIRCFKNMGYQAVVMPMTWGTNVEPSRRIAQRNMRFTQEKAYQSGKPVINVGHSKGVQDTEVEAGLYPELFEETVSMVVEVHFPNHVYWINSEVLCRNSLFSSFFVTEEDLKTDEDFANSLREIEKVKTVALINPFDNIIRGESTAQKVITVSGSHRGALSRAGSIKEITAWLPRKSSIPFPTAA